MNKEITDKIKKLRTAKGINQSEMARRLNIERSTYHNIESGEGYAWAKYLNELMTILETTPKDFFSDIGQVVHQSNYEGGVGYVVKHLHQENKEIYEKLIISKDEIIAAKDEQIEFLKGLLEKMMLPPDKSGLKGAGCYTLSYTQRDALGWDMLPLYSGRNTAESRCKRNIIQPNPDGLGVG